MVITDILFSIYDREDHEFSYPKSRPKLAESRHHEPRRVSSEDDRIDK